MIELSNAPETTGAPKIDRAAFLTNLLNVRQETAIDWLNSIRDRAAARVQELAIPTTRAEEWRFTDLSDLLQVDFQAVGEPPALGFANIEAFILPEAVNSRLVFVDGVFDPALSAVDDLPDGVIVTHIAIQDLLEAAPAELDRVPSYLDGFQGSNETFTTLNTASMADGAVVRVPRSQVVDAPIHLLFIATTEQTIAHPRVIVLAAAGSKLTVIEDFVALSDRVYFTNTVTQILIEENADVNHTRVQRDSSNAFHIGKTAVTQARDSHYTCNAISLGAKLSRHNLEVYQQGEQTETTLNGLTMLTGEQVGDTHSTIAFTKPHGTSQQIHKCVVDDRAHGVFNGKISVPKLAQLTDAKQLSRNLLLSPRARIDTKPQLEITADNVKCAHGATVSQLEDDAVFYLQSRGIREDDARKLLVYAFALEVINEIPVASLRDRLTTIVRTQHT